MLIQKLKLMKVVSSPISIGAITLVVILVASLIRAAGRGKRLSEKKRKRYHPIRGTILNQVLNLHRLHDYMTDLARKHKTYRLLNLFFNEVYTADPANVEYILKTNYENFGKGKHHHTILADLLGDGIFAVDGEKWRHQRKTSSHVFSTNMLRDFSSTVFKTNATTLAAIVADAATSHEAIEIQELFMKSTLDSIFKIVLDVELDSIGGSNKEGMEFSNEFDEANEMTTSRYFDIFWKIKRFLNIGSEVKLRNSVKKIDGFLYNIIKTKIEQAQESGESSLTKKGDMLTRFIEIGMDETYLRDIVLNFIIAGKDTTAGTLSWFFYMMCKHPLIQEKVAKEIRKATKTNGNSSLEELALRINEEALDQMQYLHAALTETLRLYPAVPQDGKVCFSDDTFPDGFNVKKGDTVAYHPYAMGRMKSIWGDDAEDFRPERWLDEYGRFKHESPFKFTAFQGGPRICLGKEFAYRQMKIFSAVLIGSHVFEQSGEQKAVNYKIMLTMHIDGGLNLRASPRGKLD